jgi:hypothetical protein
MEDDALPATAQPEAVPPIPEAPAAVDPADAVFNQWILDCICNSPVSRDTEGYNHLATIALPELRRRLKGA